MADISDKHVKKILQKKEGRRCVYMGYWKSGRLFSQRIKVFCSSGIPVEARCCNVTKWHLLGSGR